MLRRVRQPSLAVVRAAQTTFLSMERGRRSVTPMTFAPHRPGRGEPGLPGPLRGLLRPPSGKTTSKRGHDPGRRHPPGHGRVPGHGANGPRALARRPPPPGRPSAGLPREPQRGPHPDCHGVQGTGDRPCRDQQALVRDVGRRPPAPPLVAGYAKTYRIHAPWWIRIDPDHPRPRSPSPSGSRARCTSPASTPGRKGRSRSNSPAEPQTPAGSWTGSPAAPRTAGSPATRTRFSTPTARSSSPKRSWTQVKGDLLGRLAEAGIDRQTYDILFGDYHDEFARY